MKPEMVPLEKAADELKTTGMRLLMLVREGLLQGECIDGSWFIRRSTLAACDISRIRPGGAGGCSCCRTGCGGH